MEENRRICFLPIFLNNGMKNRKSKMECTNIVYFMPVIKPVEIANKYKYELFPVCLNLINT